MSDDNRITVTVDELDFDKDNPRLFGENVKSRPDESELIRCLHVCSDLYELISSILKNTYMDIEPIVVIKKKGGRHLVLEGNRRLAVLKLMKSEELRSSTSIKIDNRLLTKKVLRSIENINAYVVKDRASARGFIGFKHVNGAHKWDSYAKAKFATDWYLTEDVTIDEIAERLGDQNSLLRSLIGSMLVLIQAEKQDIYDREWRTKRGRFGFSHLYTALNRATYQKFLGLDSGWNEKPGDKPISKKYYGKLEKTLSYIYGNKKTKIKSVIESQNPDLKNLGDVLNHSIACQALYTSNNLQEAVEYTINDEEVMAGALTKLQAVISNATRVVGRYNEPNKEIKNLHRSIKKSFDILDNALDGVHGK